MVSCNALFGYRYYGVDIDKTRARVNRFFKPIHELAKQFGGSCEESDPFIYGEGYYSFDTYEQAEKYAAALSEYLNGAQIQTW